jgi:nitrous oxidase accessory protein
MTLPHNILRLMILLLLAALVVPATAQEIIVTPEGPVATLGAALRQARSGDRIVVQAGIYREPTIVVDKAVEIIGEKGAVLDGQEANQIMTITGDSVTVRGLVFRNVGTSFVEDRAAIKVNAAQHCTIADNRFEDTFFAIYLAKVAHCRVAGNEIIGAKASESQSGNGIHLWYSKDITVENNTVHGHRDGIYFEFVEDSRVAGNVSENNLRYGLHFMFSDRCAYRDNTFRDNNAGVAVMYTKHVEMIGNRFEHNWGSAAYGLLLKDITDSRIADNTFRANTIGIYVEGSNRLTVEHNNFLENGWAIKLMADAQDNRFARNNFIGNSFDVATNSRHHYSTFSENYWDNYQGYDLDRDGFGDKPFRPVRLFSLMVEHNEPSLLLLRSFFIDLLDAAERVIPSLTPETLVDDRPVMRRI